ncbi:MAG: hypothetical protein EHM13_09230 [Acidobacteria bacterium]|nr:MAG: hypothetical protein EHM13_09230 [Acidobacteriota bacterium]
MARSLLLTITDAAASAAGRYSPRYLAHLEAHSPFRFAFLREQRLRVSRAQGSFTVALEAWLAQADAGGDAERWPEPSWAGSAGLQTRCVTEP